MKWKRGNMKQEEVLADIRELFGNINFWLQFAEVKLAGLLAINMALIISLLDNYINTLILILIIVSSIIALYGLKPNATLGKKILLEKCTGIQPQEPNLLYYQHIVKYDKSRYVEELQKKYFENVQLSKIQLDYIEEIWENAKVAQYKYLVFNIALVVDIIALLGLIIVAFQA